MQKFCRITVRQRKTEPADPPAKSAFLDPELLQVLDFSDLSPKDQAPFEEAPPPDPSGEDPIRQETELVTFGGFFLEDGVYKIVYQGSEISEGENTLVTYCLLPDGTLTFLCHDSGAADFLKKVLGMEVEPPSDPCLIFREGRTLCSFQFSPQVCIETRRLRHRLDFIRGGRIELDYSVEIAGMCLQRCEVTIDVEV